MNFIYRGFMFKVVQKRLASKETERKLIYWGNLLKILWIGSVVLAINFGMQNELLGKSLYEKLSFLISLDRDKKIDNFFIRNFFFNIFLYFKQYLTGAVWYLVRIPEFPGSSWAGQPDPLLVAGEPVPV